MTNALEVSDLFVQFRTRSGIVRAVDGVSFTLQPGERLGLVGESGSGKSTIALALLRMIKPPGYIRSGSILLEGNTEITTRTEKEMQHIRFARVAMIPQGAMNSLNPV
ncbi:MAG: ATP-binding cassette domain-containing protein, partial [Chloroflexota bacterium]|nr:ATP-binding cassette domain-containing protein [Chloroflexota bacterium]